MVEAHEDPPAGLAPARGFLGAAARRAGRFVPAVRITARRQTPVEAIRELWTYRELIARLVHRDFVAQYKQTLLGSLWHVLQPVLQALMFVVVFSHIARIPTDGVPPMLFYMAGLLWWRFFSECATRTASTFTANQHLFEKIYFPRLSVPVAQVGSNLVGFAMQAGVFAGIYLYFVWRGADLRLGPLLAAVPLLVLQVAILGLGVGSLFSACTARFRDLGLVIGFFMQLWMYASCVIYPLAQVPERVRWIVAANPIVPVIETFRAAAFGTALPDPFYLGLGALGTLLVAAAGLLLFQHVERTSVDFA